MPQAKDRNTRKWNVVGVCILFLIFFSVIVKTAAAPTPFPHAPKDYTLLSNYFTDEPNPNYDQMIYRPRQAYDGLVVTDKISLNFTASYKNWDVFYSPQPVTLILNRPAQIALVPLQSSSWRRLMYHRGDEVQINNQTYLSFLITDTQEKFPISGPTLVLLAEENGQPSATPLTPEGHEEPFPNTACPNWVHDQYHTIAPDGQNYPTWHPPIDPIYWCYFGHEHGSNPSAFDSTFKMPFGYAGAHMGMKEAHVGFKVYVWEDGRGFRFLALQHQGTNSNQAACGRFHELDVAVKDISSNEIVSQQYYVGDYGISRDLYSSDPLTPAACPTQGEVKNISAGIRFLPIADRGGIHPETWTVNSQVLGFDFASMSITTHDPARLCSTITCDTTIESGQIGATHTLGYIQGFGPKNIPGHEGVYYTDAMGNEFVNADNHHAVKQYVKPGLTVNSDIPYITTSQAGCGDVQGLGGMMTCGTTIYAQTLQREHAISKNN